MSIILIVKLGVSGKISDDLAPCNVKLNCRAATIIILRPIHESATSGALHIVYTK